MKRLSEESPHNAAMGRIQFLCNLCFEQMGVDNLKVKTALQEIFTIANEQWKE